VTTHIRNKIAGEEFIGELLTEDAPQTTNRIEKRQPRRTQ